MTSSVVETVGRAPAVRRTAPNTRAVGAGPASTEGSSQARSAIATAVSAAIPAKAQRQPIVPPAADASGTPSTVAAVIPAKTVARARGRCTSGTIMDPAVDAAGPKIAPPRPAATR